MIGVNLSRMSVQSRDRQQFQVLELLLLICLLEIKEEKDKSTLIYPEPVSWPSLMQVSVGHQHRKPKTPQWPFQSVPWPLKILMEIVTVGPQNRTIGLQNRTMNPRTWQALHHPRLLCQHQEHLDQREMPGRCALTCWLAVDTV